jgi:hypothetical protein
MNIMEISKIFYSDYEKDLPQQGQHILGHFDETSLLVYQAFNERIAGYALEHQRFGGPDYAFSRMSWIKPNFLWMMYRSGWASKDGQERILAIRIGRDHIEKILAAAVNSSFLPGIHASREAWASDLEQSEVRLQWDPDHDPRGRKLMRRAIQLGMKGSMLRAFATEWIISIEDMTEFVTEQRQHLSGAESRLQVVREAVLPVFDPALRTRLRLDAWPVGIP